PLSLPAPAPSQLSTLSLHDALPISAAAAVFALAGGASAAPYEVEEKSIQQLQADLAHGKTTSVQLVRLYEQRIARLNPKLHARRSEEHTSELQSRSELVCRLLLEKK